MPNSNEAPDVVLTANDRKQIVQNLVRDLEMQRYNAKLQLKTAPQGQDIAPLKERYDDLTFRVTAAQAELKAADGE